MNNKRACMGLVACTFMVFLVYFYFNKNSSNDIVETKGVGTPKYLPMSALPEKLEDFYFVVTKKDLTTKNDDLTDRLREIELLLESKNSLGELEANLIDFLQDEKYSRSEKIQSLWNVIKGIGGLSSKKGLYLLEYLSSLYPIELTDELLLASSNVDDVDVKIKIMDVMVMSLDIANPEVQNEDQLEFIARKSELVQDFAHKQLANPIDSKLFMASLEAYTRIMPAEESKDVLLSVLNDSSGNVEIEKKVLPLLVETSFSNEEAQEEILPSIIEYANSEETSKLVRESIDNEIMNVVLDPLFNEILTDESKNLLREYFENKDMGLAEDVEFSHLSLAEYYMQVQAWYRLNAVSDESINEKLSKDIFNFDDYWKQVSVILFSEDEVVEKIKKDQRVDSILEDLKAKLNNPDIKEQKKILIKDTISLLAEK